MMRRPGKCLLPVRMIPWEEDFLHIGAMVLFGSNYMVASWLKGEPMPKDLVKTLVRAIYKKKAEAAHFARIKAVEDAKSPEQKAREADEARMAEAAKAARKKRYAEQRTNTGADLAALSPPRRREAEPKPKAIAAGPGDKPDEPDEPDLGTGPLEA